MVSFSRVSSVCLGVAALAGSLYVLDSTGVVTIAKPLHAGPSAHGSLRGERRLQAQFAQGMQQGSQAMQQGAQFAGGQTQSMAGAGGEMGNNLANQGMQYGNHLADRGSQFGGNVMSQGTGYANTGYSASNRLASWSPDFANVVPTELKALIIGLQVAFAILYYCTVVSNYPMWNGPTPMSCQLQQEPAPCAMCSTSPTNCCLSWVCPQARAAHTFDRTGTIEYWCGLLAMFLCPFCTLCYANACTDLNPKLGGEPANPISSALCTWCCSCCVIAQDAESLDAATGARTEPCGVSGGMPQGQFGGPMAMGPGMGGPPGMMMQQPYPQRW